MLIDHVGVILQDIHSLFFLFRVVGRVAFPLFVFLIALGCIHTKNIRSYLFRLFVFAIVSQLPFTLFLGVPLLANLNIFFTLFLGVLTIHMYNLAKVRGLSYLIAFMFLFVFSYIIAELINVDYGGVGVLFIMLVYLAKVSTKSKILIPISILAIMLVMYYPINYLVTLLFIGGCFSIFPMVYYNGKIGQRLKQRWLFYSFYPAHLLLLTAIAQFLLPF